MKFKKITKVRLPFDMRHQESDKDYGVGGLVVTFILVGDMGAIQYSVGFPCYLPHVKLSGQITGYDVGYHAKKPQYEGQGKRDCDLFDLGYCYYDGSSLLADKWTNEIFSIIGQQPENIIWNKLEEEYCYRFLEGEK
jgi:hypothetical protein